jgi:hypothetical protein
VQRPACDGAVADIDWQHPEPLMSNQLATGVRKQVRGAGGTVLRRIQRLVVWSGLNPVLGTRTTYDLLGRELETADAGFFPVGHHPVSSNGVGYASGIYFYLVEVGDLSITQPNVLLK